MKLTFGKNISKYRKLKNITQEELASKLGITFQAVSKWETGQTYPDITQLPNLSDILEVSIDKLMGHAVYEKKVSIYEDEYARDDYYWGLIPSTMCYKVLSILPPAKPFKLLDIGCGEGKDAVFFARNGYDVTAFDIADAGIEKTKRLADKLGVHVNVFKADILDMRLDTCYDILYSNGVLHYIKPGLREEIFTNYRQYTATNGIHVFSVFVVKPFIPPAPENESNAHTWISGELFSHYSDWMIKECEEIIFDCNSAGIPHKHAMNRIIAEKIPW
ncbi:MAG TPA: helix-turn-helix domain-containing protein [Methylomusa anaerophila]|uniref:Tellurite methyltransferase n=1 Tax=Methylomusa anaerophila TaxID=1930071 RepID=A0A348AF25_9FIRM|nr:helix-turn-helix domain-containing protein [Methylomusa anaerophila]BBB89673.1 tellurite methyltransferase [Methylomusa anaerophila]HML89550.1 helix-turn-helix domain-containing protein [Methylomusa anaerophila]